ncbi:MAG TPA: hypothetical protein VKX25_02415 [Bryobacteraceae bacterium]|jgi:CheY-like chemotaxis protein|nr:hypothetical protein [Bryobacteraceae bacterium]
MPPEATKTVVAVLNDLMFQARILDAAKRTGHTVRIAKSQTEALALAQECPVLIILDLNNSIAEPLDLIGKLKAGEQTRPIPLLGYVSHVQTDLRREAVEHGCERVVARSIFFDTLRELLASAEAAI